jgi:ribonuclease HII
MLELFVEAYRLRLLRGLEERLAACGFARIAGVDEVGRGCLAGPVVAAAVVLEPGILIPGIDDSKLLGPEERERAAERIRHAALALAVVAIEAEVIDRVNILQATRIAMRQALGALAPAPDCAVIDAVSLRDFPFPCLPVVRGDSISYSVACASIVAKVARDRLMIDFDPTYPAYGFAQHKGYGVPEHLAALAAHGPCPLHRRSFHPVVPREARG